MSVRSLPPKLSICLIGLDDDGAFESTEAALRSESTAEFECIVVGRKPAADIIAERLRPNFDSAVRVVVVHRDTAVADMWNRAVDAARGEFIVFLSETDVPAEGSLGRGLHAFDGRPNVGIVYGKELRFGVDDTTHEGYGDDARRLIHTDAVPSTAFWRRDLWSREQPFDASLGAYAFWDFVVGAIENGFEVVEDKSLDMWRRVDAAGDVWDDAITEQKARSTIVRRHSSLYGPMSAAWASAVAEAPNGFGRRGVVPVLTSEASARESGKLGVVWEGTQFVVHSLALINREVCHRLIGKAHEVAIELYENHEFGADVEPRFRGLAERFDRRPTGPVDVHVRHQWPPKLTPPNEGHWVVIQPWEWGAIPKAWVKPFSTDVDEIWVPSRYVRSCYIRGGIPAERVVVVPNGVDTTRYTPEGRRATLRTKKKTKFLFVGGTLRRKGVDCLLEAYGRAFTAADDVCLVVKDLGTKTFYRGQTLAGLIKEFRARPNAPEIEYIDRTLDDFRMAELYRAADVVVQPYRGEGFGLPILEAMACGRPVIATGYGPSLEFADEDCAWFVKAEERRSGKRSVGDLETTDEIWLAEPDVAELSRLMCLAVEFPDECRKKGAAGRVRASAYTWDKIADLYEARLRAVAARPIRRQRRASGVPFPLGSTEKDRRYLDGLRNAVQIEKSNDKRGAKMAYAALATERPEIAAAWLKLAEFARESGDAESALDYVHHAIRACPREASFRVMAGRLLTILGRGESAEAAMLDALDIDSCDAAALLALTRSAAAAGRVDEAAHFVTRALSARPSDPEVLSAYAEFCLSMGYRAGAENALARLESSGRATETTRELKRRLDPTKS